MKAFYAKMIIKLFVDQDILKTVVKLIHENKITKLQAGEYIQEYLKNGYKKNRLMAIRELSVLSGFGCSIADLGRFATYMDEANKTGEANK